MMRRNTYDLARVQLPQTTTGAQLMFMMHITPIGETVVITFGQDVHHLTFTPQQAMDLSDQLRTTATKLLADIAASRVQQQQLKPGED